MSRRSHDVDDIRRVLDALVEANPHYRDQRCDRGTSLKYVDAGCPNCLVAHIMAELGISVGLLRALDHESSGKPVKLSDSHHPIRKRFTPLAWQLLGFLQGSNDSGCTRARSRWEAFTLDGYWMKYNPKLVHERQPWVTEANRITGSCPEEPKEAA